MSEWVEKKFSKRKFQGNILRFFSRMLHPETWQKILQQSFFFLIITTAIIIDDDDVTVDNLIDLNLSIQTKQEKVLPKDRESD